MAQMCLKTVLAKLLAEGVSKDSIHRMRFKTMGNHFGTSGYNIPSLKYLDKDFPENATQKPIPVTRTSRTKTVNPEFTKKLQKKYQKIAQNIPTKYPKITKKLPRDSWAIIGPGPNGTK